MGYYSIYKTPQQQARQKTELTDERFNASSEAFAKMGWGLLYFQDHKLIAAMRYSDNRMVSCRDVEHSQALQAIVDLYKHLQEYESE